MDCSTDHPSVASKPKRRVNTCLPEFYMAIEDRSILRAHLLSRNTDSNGNDVTTHFIAVPLDELPKYEADDNCAENSYIWEISSLTMDQLRKLLTKLNNQVIFCRDTIHTNAIDNEMITDLVYWRELTCNYQQQLY
jgi:hypothetical protein